MRFYVAFAMAVVALCVAFSMLRRARWDKKKQLLTMSVGVFAALCVMAFPIDWDGSLLGALRKALLAPVSAFQIFSLNLEFLAEIESLSTPTWFAWVYSIFMAGLYLTAPLLVAGYALTYSRRIYAYLNWTLSRGEETWFFSEPTDKAITLAKDMLEHGGTYGRGVVPAFCHVNAESYERVTSIGAIALLMDIDELSAKYLKKRPSSVLFMGNSEEDNLERTLRFIEAHKKDENVDPYLLYTFTSRPEAELLLNAAKYQAENIICRRIPENIAIVYREIELTRLVEKDAAETHILLIGCGWLGIEMLKAILWSCVRQNHRLFLTVVDKKSVRERFKHDCPGLKDRVRFIDNEDIDIFDVTQLDDLLEITHVYVMLGDDAKNLACAIKMREAFRRAHILNQESSPTAPTIHIQLSDPLNRELAFTDRKGNSYDFKPIAIGDSKDGGYYSYNTLFNPALEAVALVEHGGYGGHDIKSRLIGASKSAEAYDWREKSYVSWRKSILSGEAAEVAKDFYKYDYNAASSRAKAAFNMRCEKDDIEYVDDDIAYDLKNRNTRGRVTEHDRWQMYMLTLGYQYATATDHMAKLHEDIKPYRELKSDEIVKNRSFSG